VLGGFAGGPQRVVEQMGAALRRRALAEARPREES